MGTLAPAGSPERAYQVDRLLSDTGFFCRFVLGMDTDREENGNIVGEEGNGGVRDWGPHQEVVRFFDDDTIEHGLIWAPRYSYKSSIALGFILRMILCHPNISILLGMHSSDEARKRCRVVRDILTSNPIIVELFGDLKTNDWSRNQFTTALRTNRTLFSPTLFVGSPQKNLAGLRPDLVVFDDIVGENDRGSKLKLQRGRTFVENALALRARGTRFRMVATPWDEGDAGHMVLDAGWHKLVHLDVGCQLVKLDDGRLDLTGKPLWPNLSIDFLRKQLRGGMSFEKFSSQYLLKVVSGLEARFQRHHFRPANWTNAHRDLSGFLLCDTAPAAGTDGDLNVIMEVGLDERGHAFILDLDVGFWQMYEFCERYLAMLQRWQARVNHQREVWEKGHNFWTYTQHIRVRAKERNIPMSIFAARRTQSAMSKDDRIAGTAVRFQSKQVSVMDTVPRTWNNGVKHEVLWDPDAERDPQTRITMPGGALVEQFLRFPHHKRKDIPDTFALIDERMDDPARSLVCCWTRPSTRGQDPETMRNQPQDERLRPLGSASRFYRKFGR